jgi:hypothetical protein
VECVHAADLELVRVLLRETIGQVDLRFDTVPKNKLTRYPLVGGTIHLLECADSSNSGRAAAH